MDPRCTRCPGFFASRLRGALGRTILVCLLASRAIAATAVLTPSKDNTIYESTDRSNGAGPVLFAGRSGSSGGQRTLRSLVAFNVAGQIPAGATITSASLTLGINTPHSNATTVDLRRVLADWGEGTSLAPSGGGGGIAAATGDATWSFRFFNTVAWTTPGGDFSSTASASNSVSGTSGTVVFTSAGMVADVQSWLDNPSTNFGWLLKAQNEALAAVRFSSRQGSLPPSLQVNYAPAVVNTSPTIGDIADQTVSAGTPTGAVAFTIGDAETAAGSLLVTGSSANPTLVPNSNIVFGGSGANRTVTITPAANQTGTAIITVTVSDGALAASDTFVLSVPAFALGATHALAGGGYAAGGTLTISNTLTFSGLVTGLGWQVLLPAGAGWSYTSSAGTAANTSPGAGATELLEWQWTTVPPSPLTFSYTVGVPAGETGLRIVTAVATLQHAGGTMPATAQPDPLALVGLADRHSADVNADFRLNLTELLRVIELYNTRNGTVRTGAYAVDGANLEDGFAADPARASTAAVTLARYHSADRNQDGKVSLTELLRVIELYNFRSGTVRTGQYRVQAGSEDGFATGP